MSFSIMVFLWNMPSSGVAGSYGGLGFPDGSVVKNLPAVQEMQETWVQFLGWKNPLQEEMAICSSILAWKKSHGQRSLKGYSPKGHKESATTDWVHTHGNFIPSF